MPFDPRIRQTGAVYTIKRIAESVQLTQPQANALAGFSTSRPIVDSDDDDVTLVGITGTDPIVVSGDSISGYTIEIDGTGANAGDILTWSGTAWGPQAGGGSKWTVGTLGSLALCLYPTDATHQPTVRGGLKMAWFNSADTKYTSLQAHPNQAADASYVLPTAVPVSDNMVLKSTIAGAWSWAFVDWTELLNKPATYPATAHNVLNSTYHSDVLTGSITRGDILYGNSTPKIARLAKGTTGYYLGYNATDVLALLPPTKVTSNVIEAFTAGDDWQLNNGETLTLRSTAAGDKMYFKYIGDTTNRLTIDADGKLSWGAGGVAAVDVTLYRSGANELKTDDTFYAVAALKSDSSLHLKHIGAPTGITNYTGVYAASTGDVFALDGTNTTTYCLTSQGKDTHNVCGGANRDNSNITPVQDDRCRCDTDAFAIPVSGVTCAPVVYSNHSAYVIPVYPGGALGDDIVGSESYGKWSWSATRDAGHGVYQQTAILLGTSFTRFSRNKGSEKCKLARGYCYVYVEDTSLFDSIKLILCCNNAVLGSIDMRGSMTNGAWYEGATSLYAVSGSTGEFRVIVVAYGRVVVDRETLDTVFCAAWLACEQY